MSELELQSLLADWHSLIPEARTALAAEFATRNREFTEPPLPADDTSQYRELVTIRRYRDLSEALVARAVVESSGIFCFLKDENLVRLDWQVSNFIGGIRFQVAVEDVEAAEAILSQPIPNEISIPDQPGFMQPRCPVVPQPISPGNVKAAKLLSLRFISSHCRFLAARRPGIATAAISSGLMTMSQPKLRNTTSANAIRSTTSRPSPCPGINSTTHTTPNSTN